MWHGRSYRNSRRTERQQQEAARRQRDEAEKRKWQRVEGPCVADVWAKSRTVAEFDYSETLSGYCSIVREHGEGDYYLQQAGVGGGWQFFPCIPAAA